MAGACPRCLIRATFFVAPVLAFGYHRRRPRGQPFADSRPRTAVRLPANGRNRQVIETILQHSWPRRALALLALALVAGEAFAVPEEISGTTSGFGSVTNVACSDPAEAGTEAESIRLAFSSSASEGVVFVEAEGTSLTDDTTVSISFSYDVASGTIIELSCFLNAVAIRAPSVPSASVARR